MFGPASRWNVRACSSIRLVSLGVLLACASAPARAEVASGLPGSGERPVSRAAGVPEKGPARDGTADPVAEIKALLNAGRYADAEQLGRDRLLEVEAATGTSSAGVADLLRIIVRAIVLRGGAAEPQTLELARRALEIDEATRGPDDPATAGSLTMVARVLQGRGDLAEARDLYDRAIAIRERALGLHDRTVAETAMGLGAVLQQLGEYAEAKRRLEQALAIWNESPGALRLNAIPVLSSLGNVHRDLGDYAAARTHLEQAVSSAERAYGPEDPRLAPNLLNYGNLLYVQGDLRQARPYYERALRIVETKLGPDHASAGTILVNLANVASDIGDLDESERLYRRALRIAETANGPDHPSVAMAASNLGLLLQERGDLQGARALHERAIRILRDLLGEDHPDVARAEGNMAEALAASGERAQAQEILERAIRTLEGELGEDHPDVATGWATLGEILEEGGNIAPARSAYDRAIRILEPAVGPDHPLLTQSVTGLARTRWYAGETDAALDDALRAEAMASEAVRRAARSLSEREALGFEKIRRSGLDLAYTVLSSRSAGRLPESEARRVWDQTVRSRALVLDEMAERHRTVLDAGDPALTPLVLEVDSARNRLARILVAGPGESPRKDYREKLKQARAEMDRAERVLGVKSEEFRRGSAADRSGLAEVLDALPESSALVAYVLYDRLPASPRSGASHGTVREGAVPSYMALVATAPDRRVVAVPLGSSEWIDSLVRRYGREVSAAPSDDGAESRFREVASSLRNAIWDPLAKALRGTKRVLIVPDGDLHAVSFATLPAGRGRYLVETGPEIQYLSAERDLLRRARSDPASGDALIVGGVDFDAASDPAPVENERAAITREKIRSTDSRRASYRGPAPNCDGFLSSRFEPLPSSLAEAEDVASALRSSRPTPPRREVLALTGAEASEARFKDAAPGRRILHLATHGFFVSNRCRSSLDNSAARTARAGESPLLLSGLALAGANRHRHTPTGGEGEDGILTAEEIASLDLRSVDWAVLSACETGLGPIQSGEGVLGLRRAFEVAGAGTLILSLWSVSDHDARLWVRNLYEGRLSGLTTAEAVRQASLRIVETRRRMKVVTHPFFWGAFVAAGAGG